MENRSLTPTEVAEQLQITKNTVYELIKRGELPAYKVGRKVRIDTLDLENYKQQGKKSSTPNPSTLINPSNTSPNTTSKEIYSPNDFNLEPTIPTNTFVISGQDATLNLLSNYIQKESLGYPIFRSQTASYKSLVNLYMDYSNISATHLWDAQSNSYNIPHTKMLLPGTPFVIINLVKRIQGFYVPKGNPKNIRDFSDLTRENVTIINREKGSGSRVLLDEKLNQLFIDPKTINGYSTEETSPLLTASAISLQKADCSIGAQSILKDIPNIDFIPIQEESYDIVIKKENIQEPIYKIIFEILNQSDFKKTVSLLTGYNTSETGNIIYES